MDKRVIVVEENEGGRLDKYLSEKFEDLTRSYIKKLIDEKDAVLVNGETVKAKHNLKPGDTVSVTVPEPQEIEIAAEDIPLDIVYEDDCMLVVNKPQGMVVHLSLIHIFAVYIGFCGYYNKRVCSFGKFSARLRALS